jgi:hypothetical protein
MRSLDRELSGQPTQVPTLVVFAMIRRQFVNASKQSLEFWKRISFKVISM